MAPEFLVEATSGWARYYGSHQAVSVAVMFVHLAGLMVAGGTALSADRDILAGDTARRAAALARVAGAHRVVLAGLAAMFLSGIALAAADIETFWDLRTFWLKLGLIVALLANGAIMKVAESGAGHGARHWSRLRASAAASLVLWMAIVLASVVLASS